MNYTIGYIYILTLNPIKKQKTVEIELDTEDDVKQTQIKKPSEIYATKHQLKVFGIFLD